MQIFDQSVNYKQTGLFISEKMMTEPLPLPDKDLRAAIFSAFAADARTASADLRVGVLNGVAHLAGKAASVEIRALAEDLAKNVRGLRGVVNRIEAPDAPSPARTIHLSPVVEKRKISNDKISE